MKTEAASGFPKPFSFYQTPGRHTSEYCVVFWTYEKVLYQIVIIIWAIIVYATFVGLLLPDDGSSVLLRNISPNT